MRKIIFILLLCGILSAQEKTAEDNRFGTYYNQKKSLFELLPNDSGEIIMLGNSITDGCEWAELFHNPLMKNRGISGDITAGVLARLDEVTESRPAKIFLMIGVNDLAGGEAIDSVVSNYQEIIENIIKASPNTDLYLESVLPVNNTFSKFKNHVNKGDSIISLNWKISNLATEYGATFIDLYKSFTDDDDQLDVRYTNDGLHLTGPGYLLWKQLIDPFVKEEK
jgi:lysophospholipase L1-like esterase